MRSDCWQVDHQRGFLITPDPLVSLRDLKDDVSLDLRWLNIEAIASEMPSLLKRHQLRGLLEELQGWHSQEFREQIESLDSWFLERLMLLYSYCASAYVYATDLPPAGRIPACVAVPLHHLAERIQRPPILSYSSYVLNNWRRLDSEGAVQLDNIRVLQNFLGGPDETWFILVHVEIEARGAKSLRGIDLALEGLSGDDSQQIARGLQEIAVCLAEMIETFHKMRDGCDPEVYYTRVRPYIFGFNEVLYEGVEEYCGKPQSFRGQTAAQSSIIPAIAGLLGIRHEASGLTDHLAIMRRHMPVSHRNFIQTAENGRLRDYVLRRRTHDNLMRAYNICLRQLVEFRQLHLRFAVDYIYNKVQNPLGTGGTAYMGWLVDLIRETEQHFL